MFGHFLTKSFFRLVFLLALLLFIGVFIFAYSLEQEEVVPTEGSLAPFAQNAGKAKGMNPEGNSKLAVQNYSDTEIATRLSQITAEALSFDKSNFVYNSASMQQYFTPDGFKQYRAFLDSAGFQQTLNQKDMQSGAILEQPPLLVTNGVHSGAYKWVLEIPVTISFIPRQSTSYRDEKIQPQNRRFLLRVQFTRIKDAKDPEAVRIEIWQVLPARPA